MRLAALIEYLTWTTDRAIPINLRCALFEAGMGARVQIDVRFALARPVI